MGAGSPVLASALPPCRAPKGGLGHTTEVGFLQQPGCWGPFSADVCCPQNPVKGQPSPLSQEARLATLGGWLEAEGAARLLPALGICRSPLQMSRRGDGELSIIKG